MPRLKEQEIWRPVLGWEDYYEVSNLGRLRSKPRDYWKPDPNFSSGGCWQHRAPRVLKTPKNSMGYPHTRLGKNGKAWSYKIHRLVWESFNGPIPPGNHIDHKDGSRDNNRLENLQSVDPKTHKLETVRRTVDGEYFPEKGKKWSEAYNEGHKVGWDAAIKALAGVSDG